jgi:hypothetical protein
MILLQRIKKMIVAFFHEQQDALSEAERGYKTKK